MVFMLYLNVINHRYLISMGSGGRDESFFCNESFGSRFGYHLLCFCRRRYRIPFQLGTWFAFSGFDHCQWSSGWMGICRGNVVPRLDSGRRHPVCLEARVAVCRNLLIVDQPFTLWVSGFFVFPCRRDDGVSFSKTKIRPNVVERINKSFLAHACLLLQCIMCF